VHRGTWYNQDLARHDPRRRPRRVRAGLPLLFFLHGSGGQPTTWPWRAATGGKGYLVCGLSYGAEADAGANGIESDPKAIAAMQAFIEQVRALIAERYGIDQQRVFLTGLSMGGWGTNFYGFSDAARGRYRGYAILAAGLAQGPPLLLDVLDGKPLLLLNGEKDANLAAANRGRPAFEQAGAIVTQVVIPGEGHVPATPTMIEPLAKWLASVAAADELDAGIPAVRWQPAALQGAPERGVPQAEALLAFLQQQEFVAKAPADRPLLLFCTVPGGGDRPARAAKDCERAERALFCHPEACATPAAARAFTCIRLDVTAVDRRDNPLLHAGKAPLVVLLDRARTGASVLGGEKLRDDALAAALRPLLTAEQCAAADERIAATRPLLREMVGVREDLAKEQKALAKLRQRAGPVPAKKLDELGARIAALEARFRELRAKLRE